MKKTILAATTFVSFAGFSGELRLNAFFTDHAVLQRERPVPVWERPSRARPSRWRSPDRRRR